MTLPRLKLVITFQILFFFFLFIGLSVVVCMAGDRIGPDRNISMIQGQPEWKILWDRARLFGRDKNYPLAAKTYADLFKIKPNIEEANWEYCKVLLKIGDFSTASVIIDGLLDNDPNNGDYLLAGGAIATHWKNYETAARYYGRVFEKDPVGVNSDNALLGLATSLQYQGKKVFAFPLLEQFIVRNPDNAEILKLLASDAKDLGKKQKARKFYAKLLQKPPVDDQILLQAVEIFHTPGYEKLRSTLMLEYLKRYPNYVTFRKELANYYIKSGEFEAALAQLRYLIDNSEDNDSFLLEAGRVCLNDLNRPDKALIYYDKYLQKHPENIDITDKVNQIQSRLAKDFLAIVENDGAGQLWQDLAEITPNRQEIFRKMSSLLEKNSQTEELIEVLEILYQHSVPEDDLAIRIAQQYNRIGQYSKSLEYLNVVTGEKNKTKSYYLLKGETERKIGLEVEALASFRQGLLLDPQDADLRVTCLQLAGEMGDVSTLNALFNETLLQNEAVSLDLVLTYLDLLSYNFQFFECEKTHSWAKNHFADSPVALTRLAVQRATFLRKEGKTRRAEQLLRQLFTHSILVDTILFQLTENALADNNLRAAESWYRALKKNINQDESDFSIDSLGCRMLLLKVKILKAKGHYETALTLIDNYRSRLGKRQISKELQPFVVTMDKQSCLLKFLNEDFGEASKQSRELLARGSFDPELFVLQSMLTRKSENGSQNNPYDSMINVDGNPIVTRQIALAEKEMYYQEYDAAEKHLAVVLKKIPHSVVAKMLWAEIMITRGRSDNAIATLSQLIQQFPQDHYFSRKRIEVEIRRGRYEQALDLMIKDVDGVTSVDELTIKLTSTDNVEDLLTLARILWGSKQQEKALQIYSQLLTPPVLEVLNEKFRHMQIDYHYLTREDTFWNSIMLMLQSEPEVIAELMAPPFLIDNQTNETGKIVAGIFEQYSWQKLISHEYNARKAVYDHNYYYAEKSYKRLLAEDSSGGMIDLATIYAKIGKYRKEAQVYEAMQSSGTTSPDLLESIKRNTMKLSPQNIFTADYQEQKGRNGHIDMARASIGTSFWFTPDLNKDIRLTYVNNHFKSDDTDQSTGSDFLYATAIYEFSKGYELILGAGSEKFDSDRDIGYQYEFEFKGQLDDYVNAYMLVEKRQVYDTVEAIEQQITFHAVETGLSIETPLGLSFGADLQHRIYNDDNSENRLHGYSSYNIFDESLQWALRYDYQYLTSKDGSNSEWNASGEVFRDELPYWSPASFSEHRVSLHFQHDFLGYEQETKKSMSYYAIDNAIGFEDNENISFTTNLNIFLEMSPHFLLKSNFTLSKSDDYDEKGLSVSLHYRW